MKSVPKKPPTTYLEASRALAVAAQCFLSRIDEMTSEEFSRGGERIEREHLRKMLDEARAAWAWEVMEWGRVCDPTTFKP